MNEEIKTTEEQTPKVDESIVAKVDESAAPKADAKQTKQSKYVRTAKGKKRVAHQVTRGRAYVHTSNNNTIITVTDQNGNTLAWASAGHCGFKGPKKATPFAASMVVEKVAAKLEPFGVKELSIFVTGIGNGRDSAIRSFNSKGFNIVAIKELTPVPHNGCRPRRARRI